MQLSKIRSRPASDMTASSRSFVKNATYDGIRSAISRLTAVFDGVVVTQASCGRICRRRGRR